MKNIIRNLGLSFISCLVIFMLGIFPVGATLVQTGMPFFEMTVGDNYTYFIRAMTGKFNIVTGEITDIHLGPYGERADETLTYFTTPCAIFGPNINVYGMYDHLSSSPNSPVIVSGMTKIGGSVTSGITYWGDIVNEQGWVIVPAEPRITSLPHEGETFDNYNVTIYRSCTDSTIVSQSFHDKYWTLYAGHGDGKVNTSMREFGDTGGHVYNWYYLAGYSGAVKEIRATLNLADNTVSGWEWDLECNNCTPTSTPTITSTPTYIPTVTPTIVPTITSTPGSTDVPLVNPTLTPQCMDIGSGFMCFIKYTETPGG